MLMVGGMTRVPLVRRLVTDFFGRPPVVGLNPEEVVALGAATHADELERQTGRALLIDVANHSLGVEMSGGRVRRLIPRNTSVPASAREVFVPQNAGQRQARIRIVQGEGDFARDCSALGEVTLRELPRADRGDVPLEVVFELSSEGTLNVKATSLVTGAMESLTVEARPALPPHEVEALTEAEAVRMADAVHGPQAEENFRRLTERAERLLKSLQRGLQENPSQDAQGAVAHAEALIQQARGLLSEPGADGAVRRAEVGRSLAILVGAR